MPAISRWDLIQRLKA